MALPVEIEERRAVHALEIDLLLRGLFERYGYDFRNYARASLTRRIRRAMQLEAVTTVSALQARLLHDEQLKCLGKIQRAPLGSFRRAPTSARTGKSDSQSASRNQESRPTMIRLTASGAATSAARQPGSERRSGRLTHGTGWCWPSSGHA